MVSGRYLVFRSLIGSLGAPPDGISVCAFSASANGLRLGNEPGASKVWILNERLRRTLLFAIWQRM